MEVSRLIESLTDPASYPQAPDAVECRQTHISAVFLAGDLVYKVKKPVAPGFLDFSTLDKRLHFCREEVRLNRRLAPDVYLDVVPIVQTPDGLRVEKAGEPVEWAVKMRRLPSEATLLRRVHAGEANARLIETVAGRIAAFHRGAKAGERIASFGRLDAVARSVRDVFERASPRADETAGRAVFDRVRVLAEEWLARLRPLIDDRAARGVPRDCHGDLHIDHIYCFPDRPPPGDVVIIDCIEFNEQFRFIDPVADVAFAVMDLAFHGRRDLGRAFSDAYFRAAGDGDGRALLPLYAAYRSAVRGMVEGLLLGEAEVPAAEREAARVKARAHWLLALGELESPARRPCLVLVAGLPGTGKSTLARRLAERAGFNVVRSDVVRKELAGLPASGPSPPHARAALYSDDSTDHTYDECLRRAERLLAEGRRVIVDGTFREERRRKDFLSAAARYGVPGAVVVCTVTPETAHSRLCERTGDASDADWSIYLRVADGWEEVGEDVRRVLHTVSAEGTAEEVVGRAIDGLRAIGLSE